MSNTCVHKQKKKYCSFGDPMKPDIKLFLPLVEMQMPFGKYKGRTLCDLPVAYLEWFQRNGFPKGNLGMLLQSMYEIKLNGLEYLLDPLKRKDQTHESSFTE
jgi:uncharacterized protein